MDYKIQIITNNHNFKKEENNNISSFNDFESLDAYDFNILDLNNSNILEYDESIKKFTNNDDFQTLYDAIINMKTDNYIIFLMPQNIEIKLLKTGFMANDETIVIKNKINLVHELLSSHFNIRDINLMFDKDMTKIDKHYLYSDFCIREKGNNNIITKNKHDKITTVQNNNLLFTTIKFNAVKNLIDFLIGIKLINKEKAPEWFSELNYYDDEFQLENIVKEKEKIEDSKIKIQESEAILEKNNHFKSILYTNSDKLVEVVFEILEEVLNCDLSEFNDEHKEDFSIKFENNKVIIGEIKGVTSNVRFEHVGQVEQHHNRYKDNNPNHINETIKELLIINYERKKKPSERHEIHEDQIQLAKRNGCLIIDTPTLLNIHQSYTNNEITLQILLDYIFNNSGVFDFKNFKDI